MKYVFHIKEYDGFAHDLDHDCDDDDAAREVAKGMVADVYYVESVTISRLEPKGDAFEKIYVDCFKFGEV